MANEAGAPAGPKPLFGLSARRLRGLALLLLAFALAYAVLFESDPPPTFSEVAVRFPPEPEIDFEEPAFEVDEPEPIEGARIEEQDAGSASSDAIIEAVPATPSESPQISAVNAGVAADEDDEQQDDAEPAAEQDAQPAAQVAAEGADAQSAPAAAASQDGNTEIRVAALADRNKADIFAQQLEKLLGVTANVSPVQDAQGQTLFRVWLGPFGQREAIRALAAFRERDADNELHAQEAQLFSR